MSESAVQTIPESLIYEMVDGQPIYYQGYRDYLAGLKQLDELMGSSYLQSLIVAELVYFLKSKLGKEYQVLTNELGLQLKNKEWRAADIAIVERKAMKNQPPGRYLNIPPKIVIEIDTKAELSEVNNPFGYYHEKTDQLLAFGVEKVVWIFTDTKKVMVAEPHQSWQISPWETEIQILDNASVSLQQLIEQAS